MPPKRSDLSGRQIGNFDVIRLHHVKEVSGRLEDYWLCRCRCKNKTKKVVRGNNLRRVLNHPDDAVPGKTVSCGCLRRDAGVRHSARMKVDAALRKKISARGVKARALKRQSESEEPNS